MSLHAGTRFNFLAYPFDWPETREVAGQKALKSITLRKLKLLYMEFIDVSKVTFSHCRVQFRMAQLLHAYLCS